MGNYQTFVVPYDFSSHAQAALDVAVDLARRLGADLHLVHVVHLPAFAYGYGGVAAAAPVRPAMDLGEVRDESEKALRRLADGLEQVPGGLEVHVVEGAGVADAIREIAKELEADLIVMGTHGRTGLAHVFLGSVAERTLRGAPCPVLTVQAREGEDGA